MLGVSDLGHVNVENPIYVKISSVDTSASRPPSEKKTHVSKLVTLMKNGTMMNALYAHFCNTKVIHDLPRWNKQERATGQVEAGANKLE